MGFNLDVIAHFFEHFSYQVSKPVVTHVGVPSKVARKEVVYATWFTTATDSWHVRNCPVVSEGHAVSKLLLVQYVAKLL